MTSISCTRRLQFCAGHRVLGHENKCAHLHGHNYVVLLTAEAVPMKSKLDDVGRVIDFSVLKEKFGTWIDNHWDHGFILHEEDNAAWQALRSFNEHGGPRGDKRCNQKLYFMPSNPTAENMAEYLLRAIGPQLLDGTGIRLTQVRVWETENCFATASLSDTL